MDELEKRHEDLSLCANMVKIPETFFQRFRREKSTRRAAVQSSLSVGKPYLVGTPGHPHGRQSCKRGIQRHETERSGTERRERERGREREQQSEKGLMGNKRVVLQEPECKQNPVNERT